MKVYMVTDGCYSDYRVRGIYSTPEKAELAKKLFAADNSVDELELDDFGGAPEGLFWYEVEMDKDGNTNSVKICNAEYKIDEEWRPYGDDNSVTFYMWAADDSHAVKIANERRIRLVESNSWTTDWDEWKKIRK